MNMHNPPHVGEIIAGILEESNLGVRDLARALQMSPSTVSRLLTGQAALTPEMAVKLAKVLGSTAEMWMRLQTSYSLSVAQRTVDVSQLTPLIDSDGRLALS